MPLRLGHAGLELTAEEAFALLSLCMTSPESLDATSQAALHKLAEYCKARVTTSLTNAPEAV